MCGLLIPLFPLLTKEIDASFDTARGCHIDSHGSYLSVSELHERLDLSSCRWTLSTAHIQLQRTTLPHAWVRDETDRLFFCAVYVNDDHLLWRLRWRVATLYRFTQRHWLISGDERIEDVSAPARTALHKHLLRRVLPLYETVQDAHAVGERRAAHLYDAGIQAE